ncbi:MAG: hypothetical protein FJ026_00325 [Chloroflexi bacterium]|nr:hypothetical protein [Chloroflexota bacterium]
MQVAVSTMGTDLDAWTGVPFGTCPQFLVVDTETMEYVVISVPPEHQDPTKVSLFAIRAVARQGAQVVIAGPIKDICKQTMQSLGMDVIDNIGRMTVRQAIESYLRGGPPAVQAYEAPAEKVAVASHGSDLEATVHPKDEPCTSFLLVDPQTMEWQQIQVAPAESLAQASIHAVRAAVRAGATVVITSGLRPECCTALAALAITVLVAPEDITVREAIELFQRGALSVPSNRT